LLVKDQKVKSLSTFRPNVLLGAYTCLQIRLILERSAGFYMMTIVFPGVVIVALSWSSFFVPLSLLSVKLCIAFTSALSGLVLHILCRTALAPVLKNVSYVTAIDIWITSCLLYVVCALVVQLVLVSRAAAKQHVEVCVFVRLFH